MHYDYTNILRSGEFEIEAVDFNETLAYLSGEIKTRQTGRTLPDPVVVFDESAQAAALSALRSATTYLVSYAGESAFPWTDTTLTTATIKARHLEELRQVVDDSRNESRCHSSCTSTCGIGCDTIACRSDCATTCASQCSETSCSTGCSTQCILAVVLVEYVLPGVPVPVYQ